MEIDEAVHLSEKSTTNDGLLRLFIFTLGLLLFVYSLFLTLVILDRNILIQNGWSLHLMDYQVVIASGHVLGLIFLLRLLIQRRKIAIRYVKIAIVVGAIFRLVIDPLVSKAIDSGLQVSNIRIWERLFFGAVLPLLWYQYFRRSEDLRKALVN